MCELHTFTPAICEQLHTTFFSYKSTHYKYLLYSLLISFNTWIVFPLLLTRVAKKLIGEMQTLPKNPIIVIAFYSSAWF